MEGKRGVTVIRHYNNIIYTKLLALSMFTEDILSEGLNFHSI